MGVSKYAWLSPSGLIHGGGPFSLFTACGIRVGAVGGRRRWRCLIRRTPTCQRCVNCRERHF